MLQSRDLAERQGLLIWLNGPFSLLLLHIVRKLDETSSQSFLQYLHNILVSDGKMFQ